MRTPGIVDAFPSAIALSPFAQAKLVYSTEECVRTFERDFELHLEYGYVFNTPNMFVMGRPVDVYAEGKLIVDPAHRFDKPNAWLIYLAAGNLAGFFTLAPYSLQFVGWERDNKLRFYRWDLVKRKVLHDHSIEIDRECREVS